MKEPLPVAVPGTTRLGWIGTGIMGTSMCRHLIEHGFHVTLSTRTRSKAEPLLAAGADWADDASSVGAASDVVFTMLGYPNDVRDVMAGPSGVLSGVRPGAVVVDMTTSEPSLAVELAAQAAAGGVHVLDAPVSGGDVGARNATLSIMVGGEKEPFDAVRPCFDILGTAVALQGGPGAGQHTKAVNQTLIASNMVGVCEGLLYAQRAGLDVESVLESVAPGAAGSWSLSNLAPRMLRGDFAPGFIVDHFVKDMGIALAEARRMRLSLPGLSLAEQLYIAVQAAGRGEDGTQALITALASLSNVGWRVS
jgi:3-hydroxyisobutyrate dehydrogenase